MPKPFLEFSITADSDDTWAGTRRGSFLVELIASFVDVSGQQFEDGTKVKLTLTEPGDFVNSDDEVGGVVRCQRTVFVKEDYATVKMMIETSKSNC
jgi:hypothetical protein